MKAADLVATLRARGVQFEIAADSHVRCDGPAAVLTADVRDLVARFEGPILAALQDEGPTSVSLPDAPQPPRARCGCGGTSWWCGRGRVWTCAWCHPPAPDVGVIEWSGMPVRVTQRTCEEVDG